MTRHDIHTNIHPYESGKYVYYSMSHVDRNHCFSSRTLTILETFVIFLGYVFLQELEDTEYGGDSAKRGRGQYWSRPPSRGGGVMQGIAGKGLFAAAVGEDYLGAGRKWLGEGGASEWIIY